MSAFLMLLGFQFGSSNVPLLSISFFLKGGEGRLLTKNQEAVREKFDTSFSLAEEEEICQNVNRKTGRAERDADRQNGTSNPPLVTSMREERKPKTSGPWTGLVLSSAVQE